MSKVNTQEGKDILKQIWSVKEELQDLHDQKKAMHESKSYDGFQELKDQIEALNKRKERLKLNLSIAEGQNVIGVQPVKRYERKTKKKKIIKQNLYIEEHQNVDT